MVAIEEKNWRVTARCNACGAEFNVFSDDVALIKREISAFVRKHERGVHGKKSAVNRRGSGDAQNANVSP